MKFWKRKPVLGVGLGVGVLGAAALALRYVVRRPTHQPIPDEISPAIFATRIAHTTHGEMIYHISGSGEPLIFLHGVFWGASSYEWAKVYPRFAMFREVIAPDLIGFGESERPINSMDAIDVADSLAQFVRIVSPDYPPVMVASGMTAKIALLLAVRHPEFVSRLILLPPAGFKESQIRRSMGMSGWHGMPIINRFFYRNYIARSAFIRRWLNSMVDPQRITDEMINIFATCAQQYGAEHAIFGFLRGRLAFDIEKRLRDIAVPVHILWPERQPGFSEMSTTMIRRYLPRATVEILPGCGMLAALENPELITSCITKLLEGDFPAIGAA